MATTGWELASAASAREDRACFLDPGDYAGPDGISRVARRLAELPQGGRLFLLAAAGRGTALVAQYLHHDVRVVPVGFNRGRAMALVRLPRAHECVIRPQSHPLVARCLRDLLDCRYVASVSDLARRARASPRTLQRDFTTALGMTPIAHVAAVRAGLRDFLLQSGIPLAEVASVLGYGSPCDFSHAVRASTGECPRDRRRRLQAPSLRLLDRACSAG